MKTLIPGQNQDKSTRGQKAPMQAGQGWGQRSTAHAGLHTLPRGTGEAGPAPSPLEEGNIEGKRARPWHRSCREETGEGCQAATKSDCPVWAPLSWAL